MVSLFLGDEAAMQAHGAGLGRVAPAGFRIHFEGDLGAGKTTWVRGFLRGMGHDGPVRSPTYTLIEPYTCGVRQVAHLDLYRLSDPEELDYLGFRDLLDGETLLLIEWPEKAIGALPDPDLNICIRPEGKGRRLELSPVSERAVKLIESN